MRAMLNREMAKGEQGRQILEEEKQAKIDSAKLPPREITPPRPMYKTVGKLRS